MELFLDTTGSYLNIALSHEGVILENIHECALRSQSELIIPRLQELLTKHSMTVDHIDSIVITKGPGSYTGVRIAMTVAKVLCTMKEIPLYTLSTLQAMSLGAKGKVCVMMDARSKRAFTGFYENGVALQADSIMELEVLKEKVEKEGYAVVGDAHLIEMEAIPTDMNSAVFNYTPLWQRVDNVHALVPEYLKDQESYGK
ncbi:MAG: tRNA (adenosine(37)-N6)-threonylcarbamoyltransferase complex dimerization subunit type 1 TsaB [Erysipelotrichaceae bacterium]|nr:tRNA (adenosine(37)-N6)-threonylcarbamoyltransferase complex dimerization subunit type 1 TsaB [Erysipelotrichaceae bacterium]